MCRPSGAAGKVGGCLASRDRKQSFLQGTLILSAAAIISKIIGALLFKIPLARMGSIANGNFDVTYSVFIPIYTVSTAGFPVAVSRMVSESLTLGRFRDVRVIHRVANRVFFVTGLVGTLAMVIAAFILPSVFGMPDTRTTMLVMAPSVLLCCMVPAYRGIYEGSRNMTPTAVSQVTETVVKLLVGLSLGLLVRGRAIAAFEAGRPVYGKAVSTLQEAVTAAQPYIAVAYMVGVTAGSLAALLYLVVRFRVRGINVTRQELSAAPRARSSRSIFRALFRFAVPVAIGTMASQLTNFIDTFSLQTALKVVWQKHPDIIREMYAAVIAAAPYAEEDMLSFLSGCRSNAVMFANLIPSITLTLGISALPVITSAWVARDKAQLRRMVTVVLRVTTLVAMPAGMGMTALAGPLMRLVFGKVESEIIAGAQLKVLGITAIFICLVAPINSMLQAMGRADLPAKIVLVGGVIKLALNIVLVLNPYLNILGSAYSTLACYVAMGVLSLYALRRVTGVRIRWRAVFVRPLFASLGCGLCAWLAYRLFHWFLGGSASTVLAILAGAAIYVMLLFLTNSITKEDILMLPKGQKVAQILAKRGWIR